MAAQLRAIATSCMDRNTVALALKVAGECAQKASVQEQSVPAAEKTGRAGVLLKVRPPARAKRKPSSKTRVLRVKSKEA
jgi:hypothetical protein